MHARTHTHTQTHKHTHTHTHTHCSHLSCSILHSLLKWLERPLHGSLFRWSEDTHLADASAARLTWQVSEAWFIWLLHDSRTPQSNQPHVELCQPQQPGQPSTHLLNHICLYFRPSHAYQSSSLVSIYTLHYIHSGTFAQHIIHNNWNNVIHQSHTVTVPLSPICFILTPDQKNDFNLHFKLGSAMHSRLY